MGKIWSGKLGGEVRGEVWSKDIVSMYVCVCMYVYVCNMQKINKMLCYKKEIENGTW